jgi:hypothetical protein
MQPTKDNCLNVFQRFQLSAYFGLGEKSTNFVGAGYAEES